MFGPWCFSYSFFFFFSFATNATRFFLPFLTSDGRCHCGAFEPPRPSSSPFLFAHEGNAGSGEPRWRSKQANKHTCISLSISLNQPRRFSRHFAIYRPFYPSPSHHYVMRDAFPTLLATTPLPGEKTSQDAARSLTRSMSASFLFARDLSSVSWQEGNAATLSRTWGRDLIRFLWSIYLLLVYLPVCLSPAGEQGRSTCGQSPDEKKGNREVLCHFGLD